MSQTNSRLYPIINGLLECTEVRLGPNSGKYYVDESRALYRMETFLVRNSTLNCAAVLEFFIPETSEVKFFHKAFEEQPNVLAWLFTYARREYL